MPTVSPADVAFYDAYFSAKRTNFDYSAVDGIWFQYLTVTRRPGGTTHLPVIKVSIHNQSATVKIETKSILFLSSPATHTKKKADDVIAIYDELCRRTFSYRLGLKLAQIKDHGGFDYDGRRFMEDGRVCSRDGALIFDVHDTHMTRHAFAITGVAKGAGILGRLARKAFPGSYQIMTHEDRDVFFYLLANLYDIKW